MRYSVPLISKINIRSLSKHLISKNSTDSPSNLHNSFDRLKIKSVSFFNNSNTKNVNQRDQIKTKKITQHIFLGSHQHFFNCFIANVLL